MKVESATANETVDLIARLKSATAFAHKGLEDLPVSRSLTDPNISIDQYQKYLFLIGDVVNDLEKFVFPLVSNNIPDIALRIKLPLLEADLRKTGLKSRQYHPTGFSTIGAIDEPFALGIVYVIEGSTLGGRYILQNISSSLGYDADMGASYFGGYGNQTGSMWKNILKSLSANTDPKFNDRVVEGAVFAFETIYQHLKNNS